jgi:hypothetical protein
MPCRVEVSAGAVLTLGSLLRKGRRERLGGFGDLPSRLGGRGDGFAGCMTVPALRSGASDRPGGDCGRFSVAAKQGARPMARSMPGDPALIRQARCTTT